MDRITHEQARQLADAVRPMGGYLIRLTERMQKVGLEHREEKVYRLARAAEDALHRLWVELHYRSVRMGGESPG